jgi:hypothetical protein
MSLHLSMFIRPEDKIEVVKGELNEQWVSVKSANCRTVMFFGGTEMPLQDFINTLQKQLEAQNGTQG